MLAPASKYASVRGLARPSPSPARPPAAPLLKKSARFDVDLAASQIEQMNAADSAKRCGVQLLLPRFKQMLKQGDWRWRELREGGCLHRYLQLRRAQTRNRWRAVGRARAGFQQNPKSDLQLVASVPAYDYFRWLRQDKHFWRDLSNLRALRRDNPDITSIYV